MDIASLLGETAASSPPIVAALLIGIITSVSPCPLGSNLAAMAFLSKKAGNRTNAMLNSFSYALGRAVTYVAIAALGTVFGVAVGAVLMPLQAYSDLLLALILAFCGLVLLKKINIDFGGMNAEKLRSLADKGGFGAFLLGAGLALAFCPVSAALFFGGLLPLVLTSKDWLLLPIAYGIGTAIPVLLAVPALHTAGKAGSSIKLLSKAGGIADAAIGWLFLLGSAYYLLSFLSMI